MRENNSGCFFFWTQCRSWHRWFSSRIQTLHQTFNGEIFWFQIKINSNINTVFVWLWRQTRDVINRARRSNPTWRHRDSRKNLLRACMINDSMHSFDLLRFKYDLTRKSFILGVCMDKDRSNLARILYTFRLYEVTVIWCCIVCLCSCLYCLLVCSELVQVRVT